MAKKVLIDEDYLVFLHDQLAENQATLREILGESGANTLLNLSSNRVASTVDGGLTFHPIDGMVNRLKGWGMRVKKKESQGSIELVVKCPYAERVHPRLKAKNPKCPLGEYILGALRLEFKGASLVTNDLLEDGARLVVKVSPDS